MTYSAEARLVEFLGPRWRAAEIDVEMSDLIPFAHVSVEVETFEGEGYVNPYITYFLLIGPPLHDALPIWACVEVPDQGYTNLISWDAGEMTPPAGAVGHPWSLLHDALFDRDAHELVSALMGATGVPLEIRASTTEGLT